MNYNGFDVYKTYLAIKLHFTTTAYDYHKYNGKVNTSLEQFTKRNDRYFFYKLSNKYVIQITNLTIKFALAEVSILQTTIPGAQEARDAAKAVSPLSATP